MQLTWQSFQYDVVLRVFRAAYRNPSWIPYTVGLIVANAGDYAPSYSAGAAPSIQADVRVAMASVASTAIDLNSLSTLSEIQSALVFGSDANLAARGVLSQAITAVAVQIETVGNQLVMDTADTPEVQQLPSAVAIQLGAAQSLASLAAAQAYISRALQSINGDA